MIAESCIAAGRDPQGVRLIAVTKEQNPEVIAPLFAAGIRDLGENRLEHVIDMVDSRNSREVNFHYIGRIQSRQLAKIIPLCSELHSLCDQDHIQRLGLACAAAKRRLSVFLQVNTAGDQAKAGMLPEQIAERLAIAQKYTWLNVVGLMTMAPLGLNGEQASEAVVRRCFSDLRECAQRHQLPRLSMGMSHDFQHAIMEGATDVRIGTRLFV